MSEPMPPVQQSQQPQQPQQTPRDWWFTAHRQFSAIGSALIIMMVFWIGLNTLVTEALRTLLSTDMPAWAVLLASFGPLYVVTMSLSTLAFTRAPVIRTRQYPMEAGEFIQIFVMYIPAMFLGSMIGNILSAGATDSQATNRINDAVLGSDWRMNVLLIGLLAPVCEEWIFRKEIISRLRRYGGKTAIVFSVLAFALFHMDVFRFFYALGLGLMFGYVYIHASRLRYSVAMYMLINLNGPVLAPLVIQQIDPHILDGMVSEAEIIRMVETDNMGGMGTMMLYGTVMLGLYIVGIMPLITKRKNWELYLTSEELSAGLKIHTVYANPGAIVYLLLTVMLIGWMLFA